MDRNWWMMLAVIFFFITGFIGGLIYTDASDKGIVQEQCNQFIEDHCLCYANKPVTTNTWNWDGEVNFTELKNGN